MAKIEILNPAEEIIFNSPPGFSPDKQIISILENIMDLQLSQPTHLSFYNKG